MRICGTSHEKDHHHCGRLIVVPGAAGGGLFFMGVLDEPLGPSKPKGEGTVAGGEGKSSCEGSAAEQAAEALFVQLEPISALVISDGRVKYQVLLTLKLQVAILARRTTFTRCCRVFVMPCIQNCLPHQFCVTKRPA